jgi:hypothetical protein
MPHAGIRFLDELRLRFRGGSEDARPLERLLRIRREQKNFTTDVD